MPSNSLQAVSSSGGGGAGILPLLLMLMLGALTVLLVWNMRTRLAKLSRGFPVGEPDVEDLSARQTRASVHGGRAAPFSPDR